MQGTGREFEHWYRTGQVPYNLALIHETVGHAVEACACWLQAADAVTQAGDTAKAPHPLTAPPKANPPPTRRATSTYNKITGVE